MPLPSGTVTFLFTDIEGSTRLWEEHPEAMRVALARHDTLLRQAIEHNHGLVFKTIGDAFCAAFATPSDALTAALAAQLLLLGAAWEETGPLRVRMALHTGEAYERDGDYFGQTLNRVARLQATGAGQQTLLSQTTYALVRDSLPPNVSLQDLGPQRLKDLQRPEQVFQLDHPALPKEFPPLKSLDNPELPNNLPQQVTSFIGRETEISAVKALLAKTRLLTLTGSGGSGKTRLALQVAAEVLETFPDGAWFVELAPLADPALVTQTLAQTLSVIEEPGLPLLQTLSAFLQTKKLLLILDNCEHLLAPCAHLANSLLRSCPHVMLLASSREGLSIAGEQTYRVPSLSLPDARLVQTVESVSHYEAVRLFIERALAVQSTFTVTNTNAPTLAQLCIRLDGIPLAIELAAARVRSLAVEEINSKLDNRFRLLTGGSRTALPRQQTLRALIDWSYDLLSASEKTLLCRLSVFAGGWTLEAAEAVGAGETVEEWEVLDLLTSLVDKSLVATEQEQEQTRYRLLETVRQYARDRLVESGEGTAARERHQAFFVALAEEAKPRLQGAEQAQWLHHLEREHDNLRAALEWGQAETTPEWNNQEAALRIAGALFRFWEIRSYFTEGRQWLEDTLALSSTQINSLARVDALTAVGALTAATGNYSIALPYYEQALQMALEMGNTFFVAMAKQQCALVAQEMGNTVAAAGLLEEAMALYQQLGKHDMVANNKSNLAVLAMDLNDYSRAETLLTEALHYQREIGDLRSIAITLNNLGEVACRRGDYDTARACQAESLQITLDIGAKRSSAYAFEAFADIALCESQWARTVHLWGVAQGLREANGCPLTPVEQTNFKVLVTKARSQLSEEQFVANWNAGRTQPLQQAVETAVAGVKDLCTLYPALWCILGK